MIVALFYSSGKQILLFRKILMINNAPKLLLRDLESPCFWLISIDKQRTRQNEYILNIETPK